MDKGYNYGEKSAYSDKSEPAGPPQTAVDEIYAKMDSHHDHAVLIRDRINGVLVRAFGESPQTGTSAAKPRPVRSGQLGAIEDRQEDMSDLLTEICDMLHRLETIA